MERTFQSSVRFPQLKRTVSYSSVRAGDVRTYTECYAGVLDAKAHVNGF